MADKLNAGWTQKYEEGMERIHVNENKCRVVIIRGPSIKPNPVLQKYEVEYAIVPQGEIHDEKKHPLKIKFFTHKKEALNWIEEVGEEFTHPPSLHYGVTGEKEKKILK